MTDAEVQAETARISREFFNRPFTDQAFFNGRLRTTGGRFNLKTHNIDYNPRMFAQVDAQTRAGIIKHELCHYHLYLQERGYQHGDRDFKELLARVGGSHYAPRIQQPNGQHYWVYACVDCGQQILRKRRFNTRRYVCARCGGHIRLVGEQQTA